MSNHEEQSANNLVIRSLQERAKELRCIYEFEELFKKYEDKPLKDFFKQVEKIIPPAFQFPEICHVKIKFEGGEYGNCTCDENSLYLQTPIVVDNDQKGFLQVCYVDKGTEVFFLPEEKRLVNTIARRIGRFVFYKRLRENIGLIKEESEKRSKREKAPESIGKQSYWEWRMDMAGLIANELDAKKLGVKALYIIGSTKTGEAGPKSDIDLMAHSCEDKNKHQLLEAWIDGWGRCLAYVYKEMTGIEMPGSIIDLHIITDEDIKKKTSFAAMLSSVSNTAKILKEYKK